MEESNVRKKEILEDRIEKTEKEEKKSNIIKIYKVFNTQDNIEKAVESYLRKEIQVDCTSIASNSS